MLSLKKRSAFHVRQFVWACRSAPSVDWTATSDTHGAYFSALQLPFESNEEALGDVDCPSVALSACAASPPKTHTHTSLTSHTSPSHAFELGAPHGAVSETFGAVPDQIFSYILVLFPSDLGFDGSWTKGC